jgi:hypothetical protein
VRRETHGDGFVAGQVELFFLPVVRLRDRLGDHPAEEAEKEGFEPSTEVNPL